MSRTYQLFARVVRLIVLAVLVLPALGSSLAQAQLPPLISYILPAGGQRGQTVEIGVRGRYLIGATGIHISGEGISGQVIAVDEPEKGKRVPQRLDAANYPHLARLAITIAPDAPVGERDIRVVTPAGVSNRFPFYVGDAPEITEPDESNSLNPDPIALESLPVIANGQIFQADTDVYKFQAKAGETIVFDVDAQSIIPYIADGVPGWFQSSLRLNDAQGNELAYVDDFRHQPDPLLVHTFERDGEYTIEIKDVLYRGRSDFVYRLSIGTRPYVTHIFPLGAKRGSEVELELYGVNLPQNKLKLTVPTDSPSERWVGGVTNNGLTSNVVRFAAGDMQEGFETEPNNAADQATRLKFPVTINGRIGSRGDVDYFVFTAKAGQSLKIESFARRLDSPLDSLVTVLDTNRRVLTSNDDTIDNSAGHVTHHADSYVTYTFRTDGDYLVKIEDAQSFGGQEYAYRLVVAPPNPDFLLRIQPDNPRTPQGSVTFFTVNAFRFDGFTDEIRLSAKDSPPGFSIPDDVIPERQNSVRMTVAVPLDVPIGTYSPRIVGTAVDPIAKAEYAAAEKAVKDAEAAAATAKANVDKAAAAQEKAEKPAIANRQQADAAKKKLDDAQNQQKMAEAKTQASSQSKESQKALESAKKQVASANRAYEAAEKTAKTVESAAATAKAATDKAKAAQAAAEAAIAEKRNLVDEAKPNLSKVIVREAVPSEDKMQAFYYMHNVPTKEFVVFVLERGPLALTLDLPPREVLKVPRSGRVELVIKASIKEGVQPGEITLRPASTPREWQVQLPPIPAGQSQTTMTITVFGNMFVFVGQRGTLLVTATMRSGNQTIQGYVPAIPYEVVSQIPQR